MKVVLIVWSVFSSDMQFMRPVEFNSMDLCVVAAEKLKRTSSYIHAECVAR